MLHSYTVKFQDVAREPISRSAEFVDDGGTAEEAVAIIAAISRIEASLPPQT
jgi:hypothetical protein